MENNKFQTILNESQQQFDSLFQSASNLPNKFTVEFKQETLQLGGTIFSDDYLRGVCITVRLKGIKNYEYYIHFGSSNEYVTTIYDPKNKYKLKLDNIYISALNSGGPSKNNLNLEEVLNLSYYDIRENNFDTSRKDIKFIGDITFKLMQNFKEEFVREFVNLF